MSRSERRSSEAFETKGIWWNPPNSGMQLVGSFTWSPVDGGNLALVGCFAEDQGDPSQWSTPILHGVADRDEYTLLNCHTTAFNLSVPGVATQRMVPFAGVLVGQHLADDQAAVFDRLKIEIDFLADLSNRSNIEIQTSSTFGRTNDQIEVRYEQPADINAVLARETVRLHSTVSSERLHANHLGLEETVALVFESHHPVTLEDLVDRYVSRVRDLVTFAAQRPAAVRSIRVAGPSTLETMSSGRMLKRDAQFLATFLPEPSAEPVPRLTRSLLRIPDDDRSFRALLRSWFEVAELAGPVLDLRFAAGYANFVYAETRFLNMVQAVEAFHRRLLAGEPDPVDVNSRDATLAVCPPEHRKWLEGKLAYAHEPTLRKRLRETIDHVGAGLRPVIPRPGPFINGVVQARNDLTHWDKKRQRRHGEDLFGFAVVLGYVVDGALLRLLSHSEADITDLFAANEHFRWAASRFGS